MSKKAIITGITGQDGAYLAALLLAKGYAVCGVYRRVSTPNFWRLQTLGIDRHTALTLVETDITDSSAVFGLIEKFEPDEIYNLAAQSFVPSSFSQPLATMHTNALGTLHLLEAIRICNPKIRFYQASTSEMFGNTNTPTQNEQSPFCPCSPYATSKLYAHWLTINYAQSYNIFACSGILFNHESPLRGKEFVTRKITDSVAKISLGKLECLELGNLYAKRDWGFAKEYVQGMWQMLQYSTPETFVLATGKSCSIKEFVQSCFALANMPIVWEKSGQDEIARDEKGIVRVRINPKYYRPNEVNCLIGDATKAHKLLGWKSSCDLQQLCKLMLEADMQSNSH